MVSKSSSSDPDHGHHSHDHDHDHAPIALDEGPPSPYQRRQQALERLLIEKGILTANDIRRQMELAESAGPHQGARLVARAWVDDAFRRRLLDDGRAAATELGLTVTEARLTVVENTPTRHNVIVCTLCSCYPRSLLGQPPSWYVSKQYRARTVRDPRGVIAEFGLVLPEETELRVHDSTAELRYLVLPMRPDGTDGWTESALAELVGRDCLIGTAVPHVGA